MCGILGFNWNDPELAKKLGDLIKSRGPDQDAYYIDDSISLGHRRLSIIDLSEKGRQPMFNEDKNVIIVFNGEIYNYQEIKKDLLSKNHVFNSMTDTEVIIHAYEEYGVKCLDLFNGQFAFCIYDKRANILFLARDRIGINPLFYYQKDDKFIFGSELKVILEAGISKEINTIALNFSILFGWPHHKECIIKNAYKVEPGHYIIYDILSKRITKNVKYWDVKFTSEIKDEKLAKKLVLEKLDEAVKKRLVADVPVGAFLSGGVDSSTVVALMSKYTTNLNTFSVKFEKKAYDESRYAKMVSRKYQTNHHEIVLHASDVKELIPKLVYHYDEPFGDSSMIPTYLVSNIARQFVTVSLSGDGGDELFGGYESYAFIKGITRLSKYMKVITLPLKFVLNRMPRISKMVSKINIVRRLVDSVKLLSAPMSLQFCFSIYNQLLKYVRKNNWPEEDYYKKHFFYKDPLANMINTDLHCYLPDDILTKVDRASLANSLESRPPFLDHELVELACKIDSSLKIKGNEKKYILKESIEDLLPRVIIYRKKMGFALPLDSIIRSELKELVVEKVQKYNGHHYFDHIDTTALVNDHLNKKADNTRYIWFILMFNLWWERWMNK